MPYSLDDIKVLDPIAHVRAHPEMYLPFGCVDASALAARIVRDVLVRPDREVVIQRVSDWWIVASDVDWIAQDSRVPAPECFSQVVAFPELGVNSMRSEILLTAFARDVVTFDAASETIIQGESGSLLSGIGVRRPEWQRVIAFRRP